MIEVRDNFCILSTDRIVGIRYDILNYREEKKKGFGYRLNMITAAYCLA